MSVCQTEVNCHCCGSVASQQQRCDCDFKNVWTLELSLQKLCHSKSDIWCFYTGILGRHWLLKPFVASWFKLIYTKVKNQRINVCSVLSLHTPSSSVSLHMKRLNLPRWRGHFSNNGDNTIFFTLCNLCNFCKEIFLHWMSMYCKLLISIFDLCLHHQSLTIRIDSIWL